MRAESTSLIDSLINGHGLGLPSQVAAYLAHQREGRTHSLGIDDWEECNKSNSSCPREFAIGTELELFIAPAVAAAAARNDMCVPCILYSSVLGHSAN